MMTIDDAKETEFRDKPIQVEITADTLLVTLGDGRILGVPIAWYPFLANASEHERRQFTLLPNAILWEGLDDGISVRTLKIDIQQGQPTGG